MYKKLWGEGITPKASSESEPVRRPPPSTAVGDPANLLTNRESIARSHSRSGEASATFRRVLVPPCPRPPQVPPSVAESESTINLFSQTQSLPKLQVVPILFRHSLKDSNDEIVRNLDHIFGVKLLKITSPSTDSGVLLALRVLEGCCLLHPDSAVLAHQHKAIQVLMNILPTRGVIEQGACLDALIAIMLDSSANQNDFEAFHGIEEVAELVRDKQVDENLRWSHKSSCDIWSLPSKEALCDQIRVLPKPWGNGWCQGGEGVPKEAV